MENILLVEESVDATYFTIQLYNPSVTPFTTEGVILSFIEEDKTYTYTFEAEDNLLEGVQITPTMLALPTNVFNDGIKTFTIEFNGETATTTEGFAAIVADKVMREAANYTLEMDYQMKEAIWDRVMLLGNLSMAATVGSIGSFERNLKLLERVL